MQDTMWDPPMDLSPGVNQPNVGYFEADEARITTIVVTQGSILWELSPFAPAGYPTDKPLLALGSDTTIAFGVSVVEDFEVYSDQSDTTGSSIPDGEGGFVTIYAINAGAGATGPRVASVSESLASETNKTSGSWNLESQAGMTGSSGGEDGFVLIGDLPSLSDAPTAGPFSDFFGSDPTNRDPKDMAGSSVRITQRQRVASPEPTDFRLLMFDDAGNASATALTAVDSTPTSFSFPESAFSIPVGSPADKTRVTGIAVELFTTPGQTVNLILEVEEVAIDFVPEPDATLLMIAALSTVGVIARARGKRA